MSILIQVDEGAGSCLLIVTFKEARSGLRVSFPSLAWDSECPEIPRSPHRMMTLYRGFFLCFCKRNGRGRSLADISSREIKTHRHCTAICSHLLALNASPFISFLPSFLNPRFGSGPWDYRPGMPRIAPPLSWENPTASDNW